jgi:hypothetical protein
MASYKDRKALISEVTPNVAQWRANVVPRQTTRAIVKNIISKKKRHKRKVLDIPEVLGTEALKNDTEDKKLHGSWKPWIVGDFEEQRYQKKLAKRKKPAKKVIKSLIPKSVLNNPEFIDSVKSKSIPELIRKRESVQRDLKKLKDILKPLSAELPEALQTTASTDHFQAEKYAPRLRRDRMRFDSFTDRRLKRRKSSLNLGKILSNILEDRPVQKESTFDDIEENEDKERKDSKKFRIYRKIRSKNRKKNVGFSDHRDAEMILQKVFVLRYTACGIDNPGTVEAKNELLHCYKLIRKGAEYIELSKTPDLHFQRLYHSQHLGYDPFNFPRATKEQAGESEGPPPSPVNSPIAKDGSALASLPPVANTNVSEEVAAIEGGMSGGQEILENPEWVVGVVCQQSIQLRTPRKFERASYFSIYMGAYKTQYLAWNLSAEKMKEAISSFGEVIDALLDVNVTKTEQSKLGHYEWLVTLTAQSESLPLLQIWTPDDSQLQFAVHFIPAGALASAMKKEEAFLGSSGGDKPSRKRIVSPKVVRADHLLETDKVGNEDETKSPRAVVKGALEHGNYKLASKVVLQDMENNGVTPGQMRVFRTTLDKISSYPKRGDFHIDIKLTCSQHIIIGNAVPIEYVYTHKDQAGKPHDVLDCIGIFFLGPGDATLNNIEFKEKPKMVGKAYVPEGNAGVLTFQDVTSGLGTYEVRYLLKGSAVSIGGKKRFHATHPAVRVKSASRCTIDEHLEIPFEFEYQLGDISLDLLDDDHPPDWAGIYAIDAPVNDLFGHFDHKKPIAKITMEGVKGKYKFLHGYPKFPGKYQVRVISGRFPDVILGKSEAFIVDAVSVIPSKQDLTDSRDILFYLSAPPEGTELDRETFYNSIMPSLVHLCDERRVSFSVVDPHLISGFNLKPNQSISPHMVDTFIEQIVKCRPYGLYFLPLNYGEIPKMLSPSLIAEFPWLKHYDNKKPGSGLSLCEIELMVGLVVPQFQHDEIAANTVVCYQHIDYKPAFEPQSPHTSAAGTKLVLDGPASADAQFDLKERVTGTDAQFVKNYYQSKSLKVPLTRCFRKIINQQFSKKDIPSWLKLGRLNTTLYLKNSLKTYIDLFPDVVARISNYVFFNNAKDRLLYHKPMVLASQEHGGGATSIIAGWMQSILPRKTPFNSVLHFKKRGFGRITVITICFASTSTRSVYMGVRRALLELKRLYRFSEQIPVRKKDLLPLIFQWSSRLQIFGRVVFILDGIDHLEEISSLSLLTTLQQQEEENLRQHFGIVQEDSVASSKLFSESSRVSSSASSRHYGENVLDEELADKQLIDKIDHSKRRLNDVKMFLDFIRNYTLPPNVRVVMTTAKISDVFQLCSETWNITAIPRLTADDRVTLIRHYHELWNIKLDMPTGSDAPASEVARDSDSEVDGQQGLKIEETDEVEQTIDPDSYGSVRVVGNLVRNIIVHQNFDMASQIEQDAPDAGTKKPPASPTQREEKEALVVVDTLAAVEIMFKQHPCSRQVFALMVISPSGVSELEMMYAMVETNEYGPWLELQKILSPYYAEKILGFWCVPNRQVRDALRSKFSAHDLITARRTLLKIFRHPSYTASNREASIRPFLLKGMPLQRCIIHPPVFEVLVTDEHWPNLLQFIEHLKLPVVKFVRLIRRSIEKFYNIGYIGRHAKDDLVYVYQKAAKPTRRGGTLNVTVADYRRDVAKQLVGIIRLLCHRKQFRAAEAASKCAICLNMGVLQLEDIPKGNLVDLEACEKSCFFMAYTHCYNDINAHFHNATKRHKAEVHEKHMKKKEKSLMNVFQMLEEKNVKTKAAKGIILRNKTHRSQIRRVRMKRRSHSACRLLGSKLARFPARSEKSKEAQCPYI